MLQALARDVDACWRARQLTWVLARREIAARQAGSAGGVLWAYAQPLLTIAAYYLVFDVVFAMRLGENAPTRAVGTFLIVGALPWMAFCDAVSRAMNSLLDAGGVLKKNPLPPVLFPVRSVLASTVIFAPLMVLAGIAYAPLHRFSPALLAFLPLLAMQLAITVALGYLLAVFAAALRDTVQVVGFLLSVGIFLSPVLFPITLFPESWRWVLWFNPMTALVTGYQAVLLQGRWPDASTWLVSAVWLGALGLVLDVVVRRSREQLVDWI
jgi:lipopolysaccharide transport system permease protein